MEQENKSLALLDPKKPTWIVAALVALATFLVYLPALQNGFVNWDDQSYVYENQNITLIDLNFFRWGITSVVAALWHPLTMFSLALDYAVWGLDPLGYHLTNVLIHSLNTFLVFILVIHLIKRYTTAGHVHKATIFNKESTGLIAGLVTALLFGIHPLRVESVVWISERKDVLCAFFFLLSLLAYLRYTYSGGPKKRIFYTASLISFTLALMSKPMAVTLPAILLILDFYPLNRLAKGLRRALVEKIPFFTLSILSALLTIWASSGVMAGLYVLSLTARICIAVKASVFYLIKTIIPFNLAPFYPLPKTINPLAFEYLLAIFTFSTILFLSLRSLKRERFFFTIWLYYLIALIPVIGIVKVGNQAMADRYTYLPSLGPFLLLGLGAGYLLERFPKKQKTALAVTLIFLFALLAIKAHIQIPVWKDPISLWSHEISLFPDETMAYINRGTVYRNIGDQQLAIKDFDTVIKLDPKQDRAYYNRGIVYSDLGNYGKAIMDFNKAIELAPQFIKTYINRGNSYLESGNYQEAIDDYNKAIELDPGNPDAYYNRGTIYGVLGNYLMALKDFGMSIKLDPRHSEAYNNLGNAYMGLGKYRQATDEFKKAVELNPEYTEAYYNLGLAYSRLGDTEQGLAYYRKAADLGLKRVRTK